MYVYRLLFNQVRNQDLFITINGPYEQKEHCWRDTVHACHSYCAQGVPWMESLCIYANKRSNQPAQRRKFIKVFEYCLKLLRDYSVFQAKA